MVWPFKRSEPEQRADSSYTDALVAAIQASAGGEQTAFPHATAALEASAGIVGRAFASAEVLGRPSLAALLDPSLLAMIGRSLIRRGEIVLLIRANMDGVRLLPCESHDIDGAPDPASWRYRCTVGGPQQTHTFNNVPAESVIHLTYARDPERPWRGVGPLYAAQIGGRLSANTAAALADEAGGPRGHLLEVPVGGGDASVASLKNDIATLRGRLALIQGGDWDAGGEGKVGAKATRIGADPPAGLVSLAQHASAEIFAACGVPVSLFIDADGTGQREGYRRLMHGTIAPLGRVVERELSAKLESPMTLNFDRLFASDLMGRARSFQSLVNGGLDVAKAAALSGLLLAEDD